MSTVTTLLAHEGADPPRLRRFLPRFRGREGERRMITVVPELFEWLHAPVKGISSNRVKAQARTHFGQFVKGEHIDDLHFIKRVEDRRPGRSPFGHEVWSVSPRFEPPQYRYFGLFATQNWFVACCKQSRDILDEHPNRWHAEIDKALRIWSYYFGSDLPHAGAQLNQYVSHNADHLDDRWP
jgi:hypothetical protein